MMGVTMLLLQVLVYSVQSKNDMYDSTRPFVLLVHLVSLIWFITLQYYRFKQTGRACSGDYIQGGFGSPFHFFNETSREEQEAAGQQWPKDRPIMPKYLLID